MPFIPVSGGLVDFGLGAALITLPQYKLPLVAGTVTLNLIRRLRRRSVKAGSREVERRHAENEDVHLQWSNLTCSITNQSRGTRKKLLCEISGEATPGRCSITHWPASWDAIGFTSVESRQVNFWLAECC